MACAGTGCGGMLTRIVGSYLEGLRDECQGEDSNGDIRVGGRVHFDSNEEIKLFSKPG
jgi:hypothetical protein